MHFEGRFKINAPKQKVWDSVMDPGKVVKSVPGLESYEIQEEKKVSARVKAGVGMVRGTFKVKGSYKDIKPEAYSLRYLLSGSGVGSMFDAEIFMRLSDVEGGTEMVYEAEAITSGILAGLAGRIIEKKVTEITEEMFANLKKEIEKED
ncbi:MAG: CoxG family protein [Nitrososphaeria archaeon]